LTDTDKTPVNRVHYPRTRSVYTVFYASLTFSLIQYDLELSVDGKNLAPFTKPMIFIGGRGDI
jgi:hypothetical protein